MRRSEQFLDTNIFLRHLLGDEPVQSPRATAYFRALQEGHRRARISDIVIFEVVFTLERGYRRSKREIQSAVLPLIELPGIVLPGKRKFREIFRLYTERNISFADAYHVVMMEKLYLSEIVSFDRDFDRIAAVQRVEPDSTGELV
jgi:predicted nucleic acid-binding protein